MNPFSLRCRALFDASVNLVVKVFVLGVILNIASECLAQEKFATPELLAARKTQEGNQWRVPVNTDGPTRIPRVCASLRAAYFEGTPGTTVSVHPEVNYWELKFEGEAPAATIVLQFDSFPFLLSEVKPTKQQGDGSLTLKCSHGQTNGSKLRFEPQPHKNTIGYWAEKSDSVSWPIEISKVGSFNVGILQGAGNSGGGTARVSLLANGKVVDSLEFKVQVTGHYQNFVWKNAGQLKASDIGEYAVKIEAVKIDQSALMDVRQVHLSPKR